MNSSRQLPLLAKGLLALSFWGCSDTGSTTVATGGNLSLAGDTSAIAGSSNAGAMAALGGTVANTGGSADTGGALAAGGTTSSDDSTNIGGVGTGGTMAGSAGGAVSSGGSNFTGGTSSTGGTKATSLNATGGAKTTGGNSATGAAKSTGGTTAAGGTKTTGGMSSSGGTTSAAGTGETTNCSAGASDSCPEVVPAMCGMLATLNAVRASAPGANPPIPPLAWDCSIAATAQAWADTCPAGHNPALNANNLGENIYGSGSSAIAKVADVVKLWVDEGPPNYIYATNDCYGAQYTTNNFKCGHYTQIVWRSTTRVGCGYKTGCGSTAFSPQIWVCDFAPAGNMYNQKTTVFDLPY